MKENERARRYVIYLRKSTDDAQKQVRSIGDQRAACEALARTNGITVKPGDVIVEDRSARRSGNRPRFSRLLQDIRAGRVDGLISWAPDRLARNMKEAGEIIDLLDAGFIVDLKFASYYFHADYDGVMALGIAFVLAKQYTDKLAHDVRRGISRALQEGRSGGQNKAGYVRDERTGRYRPDTTVSASGKTMHELIREAWQLRIRGESLRAIETHLNESGYFRRLKRSGTKQLLSRERVRAMFADSFYYGVLKQGKEAVDLRKPEAGAFEPMVDEDLFTQVQRLCRPELATPKIHKYPFKGLLICGNCRHALFAGAPRGRAGVRYLRYWCGQSSCPSASIRAKDVLSTMVTVLERLKATASAYGPYLDRAKRAVNDARANLLAEQAQRAKQLHREERNLEASVFATVIDAHEERVVERRKETIKASLAQLEARLQEIRIELSTLDPLDVGGFLNTLKRLPESLKTGNAALKDEIAKTVFLNIEVVQGKIAKIRAREPIATLLEPATFDVGGPVASDLEPPLEDIIAFSQNCHKGANSNAIKPSKRDITHYSQDIVY